MITDYFQTARIGIEGMTLQKPEKLLTPREVAQRFAVDPKTVTRWALAGLLPSIKTPGGHRRYRKSVIDALATERTEGGRPVAVE